MISTATRAPRLPSFASCSSVPRRERTSANSAATKKPLSSTSTNTAKSSSMLMRGRASRARRYFEEGRRRSSGDEAMLPDPEAVNPGREVVVGLRDLALGVGAEREPHLVPAVDQDVGVVVGALRHLRHL